MNVADQADGGPYQELEAADNKQPDCGGLMLRKQEEYAPHQKPDGDEEIIDDADHLVAAPDDQLFVAKFQGKRIVH